MNINLWFGAIVSLVGVALGGAISFLLNRQQIGAATKQRIEDALREKRRRSVDRRFAAYSDFLIQVRKYREALRPLAVNQGSPYVLEQIDSLANSASNASALVFLVVENRVTYEACRAVVASIARIQSILSSSGIKPTPPKNRRESIEELAELLRELQSAIRDELDVSGIERSVILTRKSPTQRLH